MSRSFYAVCLVAGLALSACSSATFTGATPQRAQTSPEATSTQVDTGTETESPDSSAPSANDPDSPADAGSSDASTETSTADDDGTTPSVPSDDPAGTGTASSTSTDASDDPSDDSTAGTPSTPGDSGDNPGTQPTNPGSDPSEPPCQDQTRSIGAQIAFLIDNSQSNEATDCPFPVQTGASNSSGQPLYRCDLATNREKAVMASFDLLRRIANNEPGNAQAVSSVAVTSFPASELAGYQVQAGWRAASDGQRPDLADRLRFTRQPMGQTPYGEAMASAQQVFGSAASDARRKMAILVTDGMPTDRNPSAVQAKADALRAAGIKVVTVYVTGSAERSQRIAQHRSLLGKFEAVYQSGNQHWYDTGVYASFDQYATAIMGLAQGVSQNDVIEVQNSAALERTLLSIISQKAIRCER